MTNHFYRTILLIILVFAGFCTASAQESDAEEARLDHIVFIYYEGTNEYEFYKAIGNYRKYVKGKHDSHKYYQSWYKEIAYDIYHPDDQRHRSGHRTRAGAPPQAGNRAIHPHHPCRHRCPHPPVPSLVPLAPQVARLAPHAPAPAPQTASPPRSHLAANSPCTGVWY